MVGCQPRNCCSISHIRASDKKIIVQKGTAGSVSLIGGPTKLPSREGRSVEGGSTPELVDTSGPMGVHDSTNLVQTSASRRTRKVAGYDTVPEHARLIGLMCIF